MRNVDTGRMVGEFNLEKEGTLEQLKLEILGAICVKSNVAKSGEWGFNDNGEIYIYFDKGE